MQLDRSIKLPLYRQLATLLQYRIAIGELVSGDRLPALREAERAWGVSLHTVRKAYEVLEEEGIVRTLERLGTVVAPRSEAAGSAPPDEAERFTRWATEVAWEQFGLEPAAFAARIADVARGSGNDRPVWVVECSDWLAAELASQVTDTLQLDARPWRVQRMGSVPEGLIVSTYYHVREVREATAQRIPAPVFLPVQLDPSYVETLRHRLATDDPELMLCGVEERTVQAMARDLHSALGERVNIRRRATRRPETVLRDKPVEMLVVMSPENWDHLARDQRNRSDVVPHRSRFAPEALERVLHYVG